MAAVTSAHPKTTWSAFQQGLAKLRQVPHHLAHGIHTATKLPAVAAMKARAVAHDLGTHWQGALHSSSGPAAAAHGARSRSTPAPAPSSPSRAALKERFFAEHRDQLRSGQSWARPDASGQWQLAPHEPNKLHTAVEAGGGFTQRMLAKAYDLVTLPEQLGEFAASPAGEAFRANPEDVVVSLARQGLKQAKRLAVDIPSGKAMDDAIRPFQEGTPRDKGAYVAGAVFEVATWMPWAKVASGAKSLLTGARELLAVEKVGDMCRKIDGMRAPAAHVLDPETVRFLQGEFDSIGGDTTCLRINHGKRTGYVDASDTINVRGDVLPNVESNHPRSRMSPRAVLAHERGHQNYRGTTVPPDAWNDEFRASYWAAKNCPGLSHEDRCNLVLDAIRRAEEAGIIIKPNQFMRSTIYGIPPE